MRVLGVIDAINLKNLGMYGVGNGMFEARYKQQETSNCYLHYQALVVVIIKQLLSSLNFKLILKTLTKSN